MIDIRVSIYGDSISTYRGYNPPGHLVFYNDENCFLNNLMSENDTWWGQLLDAYGWELLINASYSGSRVSGTAFPAANTCERINVLQTTSKPDIILVYLGLNDYGFCVPLVSDNNMRAEECFYDSYDLMLGRMKGIYPDSTIICGTLMPSYILYRPDITEKLGENRLGVSLEKYNDLIRKACKNNLILVADLYKTGIKCDTLDGSHPTRKGHMEMSKAWITALSEVL